MAKSPIPASTGPDVIPPQEALIYVMIMASAVDRVMSDIEMETIGLIVRKVPAFEEFDKLKLIRVSKKCSEVLAGPNGFETALDLIERSLTKPLHVTAYAFATEVAAVDRTVNLEEVRLLDILAERFELSDLVVAAIQESAEARYRKL